jgi:hypothetical protein
MVPVYPMLDFIAVVEPTSLKSSSTRTFNEDELLNLIYYYRDIVPLFDLGASLERQVPCGGARHGQHYY